MVEFMDKVAKTVDTAELTPEERNLLSIAYKNLIAGRRASLKRISSIEKKETKKGNTDNVSFIKDHRVKIETEINNICDRIFNLIDSHLLPNASTDDFKVFYLKMKGDYHRYLSDSKTGAARVQAVKDTLEIYKSAQVIALNLPSTDIPRLGLALNLSLFYYETLMSTKVACLTAKEAYDAAITELHAVREESFDDTVLIMHLISDRVTYDAPGRIRGRKRDGKRQNLKIMDMAIWGQEVDTEISNQYFGGKLSYTEASSDVRFPLWNRNSVETYGISLPKRF
ncbi:unnamed protein product [Brassica oleracea var. botrytis]|uniref:14-3-3 domain-containing protein n=1 Tax=Brassica oleracea TaxID=3712 RepID=A0A3P6EN58_BRAOL|nr:unnamed protein product [Brassica oleracea]